MKVLSVTNMYPTDRRPYLGIFVKEFDDALRGIGVEVESFFTDVSGGRQAYLTDIPRLRKVLAGGVFDIIHAHHTYSLYQVRSAQQLIRSHLPVVFTIHEGESLRPDHVRDEQSDWLKQLIYLKKPKQLALNLATAVVSVNDAIPVALGYQKPFEVIPPGVDLDLFSRHDRAQCRAELGLPADKRLILFPADPSNLFKGYRLVEDSLGSLPPDVEVVTGGNIARAAMPRYMSAANVVVQISEFEASPMVVKEAMAVNVPMVTTAAGDAAKIIGDTDGYYICIAEVADVAAKINQALEFEGRIGGRERILELGLSLEQVARRYERIYVRLLDRKEEGA
jgi:glycosyltransferase involved in cell wall biosynthesis